MKSSEFILQLMVFFLGLQDRSTKQVNFFFNYLGNFTINPTHMIDCGILPIQQSSRYYANPEQFDINRWLNNELKEPYIINFKCRHAFVPFSSGPRNCIGQHMAMTEAKIMLSYILFTYRMIPDPKRKLEMKLSSLYAPADDRLVHFQLL